MNTLSSLLRGINISGQKQIKMEKLQRLYESLNLVNVRAYVQSGNVLFKSGETDPAALVRQIQTGIEQTFGFSVPVILHSVADIQRILTGNPFLTGRNNDPNKLYMAFLSGHPRAPILEDLKNPNADGDEFLLKNHEIFLFCPNGYGRTKLYNNFFEKKLKLLATTRNWNTVIMLYKLIKR